MGKPSRDKGKRGELEVAALLRSRGFDEARRGQQYHGGPDSPDVVGLPGIHIEVKRVETFHLWDALEQSTRDAEHSGEMPIIFHRRNGKPWVVISMADDWLRLYRASGMWTPEPDTEEHRLSYGELYTLNCQYRDKVAELEAKNRELLQKLQELEGGGDV
jgi:Holliday junction resolvase